MHITSQFANISRKMLLRGCVSVWTRLNPSKLIKSNKLVVMSSTHAIPKKGIKQEEEQDPDAPIKYSTTPAHAWKAETTRRGYVKARLWYEPYVVIASLSIFLIYFTMLREENDIDEELGRSLYSRIEGLEEYQLKVLLKYNLQHDKDTAAIIKRLQEIDEEKRVQS